MLAHARVAVRIVAITAIAALVAASASNGGSAGGTATAFQTAATAFRSAATFARTATIAAGSAATDVRPAAQTRDGAATRPGNAATRPERLRFTATWNELPVADAELLVQPAADRTLVLRGRAETNEVLDLVWRMRDSFDAVVALDPIRPRRFLLRQNENDRRRETTVVAEGAQLVATIERRHRPPRRAVVALGPRLHDPASIAYAIRMLPADRTAATSYDVLAGTKVYTITVTPAGKGTVEAAGRTWPARRFRLALDMTPHDAESPPPSAPRSASGVDAQVDVDVPVNVDAPVRRDGTAPRDQPGRDAQVQNAELWISSGPERVPLRMQAETAWGWVVVELVGRG